MTDQDLAGLQDAVTGLTDAIIGMLPTVHPKHAAVVLAATVRQLSAGIDYQDLVADDQDTTPTDVDPFAGIDTGPWRD